MSNIRVTCSNCDFIQTGSKLNCENCGAVFNAEPIRIESSQTTLIKLLWCIALIGLLMFVGYVVNLP